MYICRFCKEEYEDFEGVDTLENGYFCESCDSFNLYDEENRSGFTLLLEDKEKEEEKSSLRKNIKLNKRISPLRYPGGKSKMIDYLYSKLNKDKLEKLYSPFTGGASFELALLDAKVVKKLILNDKDFGVYSLYYSIINDKEKLIKKITETTYSSELYFENREIISNGFKDCSTLDAAFYTLCNNRMAYSGILKANPLGGRNGSKESLMSRFNMKDIVSRINKIHQMRDSIEIYNKDALDIIEEGYWYEDSTIFIDPPYYKKGKDLYFEFYKEEDHINLSVLLESLFTGSPCADVLITYDNHEEIRNIYPNADQINVKRYYSA